MLSKDKAGLGKWGTALAAAREAAGMTVRQLAEATHFSAATISNYEHGHRAPRSKEIAIIEGVLGTKGRLQEHFVELVDHELSPEWSEWRDIEEHAIRHLSCDLSVIPGLLQTEEYARTVLSHDPYSPLGLEQRLQTRLERQEIFNRDNPPTAVFIIGELVLRNQVGTREVMFEQLSRLVDMAQRPNIIVYVVPEDSGYNIGQDGSFRIAKLDGREVAYQDGIWRGQVIKDDAAVSALGNYWQHILSKALTAEASLDLLKKAAEKWMD